MISSKVHGKIFDVIEIFYILAVVVVTSLGQSTRTVHLNGVSFTVCHLYLNKTDSNQRQQTELVTVEAFKT